MADIVKQLKSEHAHIVNAFKEIRDMGSLSKAALIRLLKARDLLISHIEREDKELYPALRKVAEQDPKVKATLDKLEREMVIVSRVVSQFFNTCKKEGHSLALEGSVPLLCTTVLNRIEKEERLLLPLYARVHKKH